MAWKSLNHVLGFVESQLVSPEQQQFQLLLTCWSQVVEVVIAKYTQPISINRGVLSVATASAALAQDLTFKRRRFLAKLNSLLNIPLQDIRFSTVGWHNSSSRDRLQPQSDLSIIWNEHPSRVFNSTVPSQADPVKETLDAPLTFGQWAEKIRSRSQWLPLCPRCQCPTPPGELERWLVCALCISKDW